ncbi:hypothetical protein JXR93_00965 [bacterium]|nr:hypothetical protein [bacterium]
MKKKLFLSKNIFLNIITIFLLFIFSLSCSNFSYGKSKNLIEQKYEYVDSNDLLDKNTFLVGPQINAFGPGPLIPPELIIGVLALGVVIIVGGTIGIIYLVNE